MNKFFFDEPELPLFSDSDFQNTPIIQKYETLFSYLDLSHIKSHNYGKGCSGYSSHSMIKALIVKVLERIPSIPNLIWRLKNDPYLTRYVIGFKDTIPDESQFYRFLNKFHTSDIEKLIADTNQNTLEITQSKIETVIIDSKPIIANTKENNPKNFYHNLTDKTKKPKRNKQSTLSYFSSTNDINGYKKTLFFWGYRMHILFGGNDVIQLPLTAKLFPNNVKDNIAAENIINKLKRFYHIKKSNQPILIGDKGYDAYNVYELFNRLFAGKEVIAENKRNKKDDKNLIPICLANLEMNYDSCWYDKAGHRIRLKFRCPILNEQCTFRKTHYGCTKYRQIKDVIPGKVYKHQALFKQFYPQRFKIEQYNSVLQHYGQETPNHFKRKAIENTIMFTILGSVLIAAHNARKEILKVPLKKSA